jgi:hypothetical protein
VQPATEPLLGLQLIPGGITDDATSSLLDYIDIQRWKIVQNRYNRGCQRCTKLMSPYPRFRTRWVRLNENTYGMAAGSGSTFRIDPTACQYVYNLCSLFLRSWSVSGGYRASTESMSVTRCLRSNSRHSAVSRRLILKPYRLVIPKGESFKDRRTAHLFCSNF